MVSPILENLGNGLIFCGHCRYSCREQSRVLRDLFTFSKASTQLYKTEWLKLGRVIYAQAPCLSSRLRIRLKAGQQWRGPWRPEQQLKALHVKRGRRAFLLRESVFVYNVFFHFGGILFV